MSELTKWSWVSLTEWRVFHLGVTLLRWKWWSLSSFEFISAFIYCGWDHIRIFLILVGLKLRTKKSWNLATPKWHGRESEHCERRASQRQGKNIFDELGFWNGRKFRVQHSTEFGKFRKGEIFQQFRGSGAFRRRTDFRFVRVPRNGLQFYRRTPRFTFGGQSAPILHGPLTHFLLERYVKKSPPEDKIA